MTFGIMGNIRKPMLYSVAKELIGYLTKRKIEFVLSEELASVLTKKNEIAGGVRIYPLKKLADHCDIIIALGGDGTMLTAARSVGNRSTPILGINLGKLGFLAEVPVSAIRETINSILKNNYSVEERMVIEAYSPQKKKRFYGMNDIVIDRGASKRVVALETYVNDKYLLTYSADGLIVTTPTGSTAYSLAAGGPIIVPESNVIMLNPIAAHTLTARPLVVPDTSTIRVVVKMGSPVHITADGQIEAFYKTPAEIFIQKANYTIKLIKQKDHSFFELLRTKLLWGKDVRVGN
ncbi:MAG: NAD(+)/NADH kinase [Bacteroidetes bacterium]|nr:NAD(+)/NADH kinase [Bacteroidota bacterium]MBU1421914.1 NAD(+)/NADH kinase [Bacteroidota bacterium]MBU2637149.1 NAD(+)/NADH kinase [Bacteroidota bacterium]